MSSQSLIRNVWVNGPGYVKDHPETLVQFLAFGLTSLLIYQVGRATWRSVPWKGYPLYNTTGWDLFRYRAGLDFALTGRTMVEDAYNKFQGKIFQIFGPRGSILFLPPKFIEELKNHPDLGSATPKEFFHYDYNAFAAMAEVDHTRLLINTVTKKLTPALGLITEPVSLILHSDLSMLTTVGER
jgi:hypothetical protein